MIVRLAQAKDEAAILELAEMQVRETLPHLTFSPEITRATFRRSLTEIDPTIFVAEQDGVVIGHLLALICPYAMASGFFTSQEVVYVRPDRRGTRAAAELVRAFNEWSDHLNANEVFMGVANGRKIDRFIAFIQRLFGFDIVGVSLRRIRHG